MSIYKDHHCPPHYDELGTYLAKDRKDKDKHNPNFNHDIMLRSMKRLMDKNGEVDGYGYPMTHWGPTKSPRLNGLHMEDAEPPVMARYTRDIYLLGGALTLGYVGTLLFWMRRAGKLL